MTSSHWLRGREGERKAARYLLSLGFDLLVRRYRSRSGEIDLIAFENDILVFVEVKTRGSREFGEPYEFVDWQKQQALRRAAEDFIAEHALDQYSYRFDIVSVIGKEVTLYRNAF